MRNKNQSLPVTIVSMESNPTNEEVVEFLYSASLKTPVKNAEEFFHRDHKRLAALKAMDSRRTVLDLGAGDGGLAQLLFWPESIPNLHLIGCDIYTPERIPSGYVAWAGSGWNELPNSKDSYSGIMAIHVIEHVANWEEMLGKSLLNLARGGLIYLEWPGVNTQFWPTAHNIWAMFTLKSPSHEKQLLQTFNFFDDSTHVESPPSMDEVLEFAKFHRLSIREFGGVKNVSNSLEITTLGLLSDSSANVTMGVWAAFGFAQYALLEKTNSIE